LEERCDLPAVSARNLFVTDASFVSLNVAIQNISPNYVDTTNGTKRSFRIFVFGMRRVRLLMGSGKSNSVTFVDVLLIFENFPVWSVGLKPSRI
jgi:hypothetical protein